MKEVLTMTLKEVKRLKIVNEFVNGTITQIEAATYLSLSERQLRKIVKRFKEEGDKGVINKSRGPTSNRKTKTDIKINKGKVYRL